jgi:hypothetical protein
VRFLTKLIFYDILCVVRNRVICMSFCSCDYSIFFFCNLSKNKNMVHDKHCSVCDGDNVQEEVVKKGHEKIEQKEDISFAALLALVPAMTMTLFNLMGLI